MILNGKAFPTLQVLAVYAERLARLTGRIIIVGEIVAFPNIGGVIHRDVIVKQVAQSGCRITALLNRHRIRRR